MSQLTLTDQTPRVAYAVGGSPQDAFAVPFAFFATSDLDVYVGGVLKTISVDYTVSGTSADDGYSSGTVTLTSPVSSTDVVIERDLPIEKTANFPTGSSTLNIRTLNTQLTKIFAILQQVRSLWTRAVRLSASDTRTALELPTAAEMANKYLAGSSDGSLIVAVGSTPGSVVVSSFGATLVDDADAATARTTLGLGTLATLSAVPAGSVGASQLVDTGVTAGSYTRANITVDADGRVTAASNGAASALSASFASSDQAITLGGLITVAHGLGSKPVAIFPYLKCSTGELNWSVGEELLMPNGADGGSGATNTVSAVYADATNIYVRVGTGAPIIPNKNTGSYSGITVGNWRIKLYAFA